MTEIQKDTKQDFWEWAFEQSGTNPLAWQHSARDLLEATDAVKARVQDVDDAEMDRLLRYRRCSSGWPLNVFLKECRSRSIKRGRMRKRD